MAVIADKTVATILDFIAGGVPGNPSGESAGNYNAIIGNAHSTLELSKLTIAQIYDQQAAAKARGMPSDAIGRYQFIGPTLRSLVARFNLPLSTLFTNSLQDQFALTLMNGRGYGSWLKGEINDAQFASRLSMEWASLPDPANGGKSHYDGDSADNHASCTLASVYAMLKAARTGTAGKIPATVLPAPTATAPVDPSLVKLAQLSLRAAGLYDGEIDGLVGGKTTAAIKAWRALWG